MDAANPRQNKIARLIQKELSDMMQKYAKDWLPGVIISVTTVRISPDLSVAKCFLSVFPTSKQNELIESLTKKVKEVRYQLGSRIKNQVRKIPELVFYLDDSLDYIDNIENLLKE
jgi:ribosome-binding factor A